jgi:hypothetical protein
VHHDILYPKCKEHCPLDLLTGYDPAVLTGSTSSLPIPFFVPHVLGFEMYRIYSNNKCSKIRGSDYSSYIYIYAA